MIQTMLGGFCFRCNAEYEEDGYVHMHKHDGKAMPKVNLDTPEYRAWQVKHRSDTNKKLVEIFKMCGDIRSRIMEIMFPDKP